MDYPNFIATDITHPVTGRPLFYKHVFNPGPATVYGVSLSTFDGEEIPDTEYFYELQSGNFVVYTDFKSTPETPYIVTWTTDQGIKTELLNAIPVYEQWEVISQYNAGTGKFELNGSYFIRTAEYSSLAEIPFYSPSIPFFVVTIRPMVLENITIPAPADVYTVSLKLPGYRIDNNLYFIDVRHVSQVKDADSWTTDGLIMVSNQTDETVMFDVTLSIPWHVSPPVHFAGSTSLVASVNSGQLLWDNSGTVVLTLEYDRTKRKRNLLLGNFPEVIDRKSYDSLQFGDSDAIPKMPLVKLAVEKLMRPDITESFVAELLDRLRPAGIPYFATSDMGIPLAWLFASILSAHTETVTLNDAVIVNPNLTPHEDSAVIADESNVYTIDNAPASGYDNLAVSDNIVLETPERQSDTSVVFDSVEVFLNASGSPIPIQSETLTCGESVSTTVKDYAAQFDDDSFDFAEFAEEEGVIYG